MTLSAPSTATGGVLNRDDSLDGVRGLAVIMVVAIHLFTPVQTNLLTTAISTVFQSMFIATDLFFVLSGFLITSILLRTRGRANYFKSFYWRRALRILPAYALLLIYVFGILPLVFPQVMVTPEQVEITRDHLPWYLAYLQNVGMLYSGQPLPYIGLWHLWSLAIEEQFYLLWPLAVCWIPIRHFEKFCVAVFAVGCAFKFGMYFAGGNPLELYIFTPCRIEGLAAGGWIAARCELRGLRLPPRWLHVVGALAAAALLFLIVVPNPVKPKLEMPLLVVLHTMLASVAFAWLIHGLVGMRPDAWLKKLFSWRLLTFLGTYSYGFYLIHWVFATHVRYALHVLFGEMPVNRAMFAAGLITLAVCLPLAVLMFRWVEGPALRLKDRVKLGPRRQPEPLATQKSAAAEATAS